MVYDFLDVIHCSFLTIILQNSPLQRLVLIVSLKTSDSDMGRDFSSIGLPKMSKKPIQ
jgi:hypothetical protein